MQIRTLAAAMGVSIMLASGSAMAWDLHDTLAPGPTPDSSDAPPISEDAPAGADLRLPDVDIQLPGTFGGSVVNDNRCSEAITKHGENSAEAQTQC
jgi:hypothetical protein